MAHKLADETLSTIFFDHFHVSDDDFACITERQSPFALRRLGSSSNVLLVCKRWMRVATPLLYETVVLRSGAQAQSLAFALKSTPSLGPYIKKLRVEGGFGAAGGKILKAAPNITDIWLTLELYAQDNVVPMYKALEEHVNPRRLIVYGYGAPNNKNSNTASETLCRCIENWRALRVVHFSSHLLHSTHIGAALLAANWIEEFLLGDCTGVDEDLAFLRACRARRVELCFPHWRDEWFDMFWEKINQLPPHAHREIVVLRRVPRESVVVAPPIPRVGPIDPSYVPLQAAPAEVRDRIWGHVLSFLADSEDEASRSTRLNCLLTCKMFKTLALPIFCRRVELVSDSGIISFARLVQSRGDLARCVRRLTISDPPAPRRSVLGGQEASNELTSVLPLLTELVDADLRRVRLTELPEHSPHLQNLSVYIKVPGQRLRLPLFAHLTALSLKLDLNSSFSHLDLSSPAPLDTLPLLQTLTLAGFGFDVPLLGLATLELPRLRVFDIQELYSFNDINSQIDHPGLGAFMRAHGAKLRRLDVGTCKLAETVARCPNLTSLHIPANSIFNFSKTTLSEAFEAVGTQRFEHLDTIVCPAIYSAEFRTPRCRRTSEDNFAQFIDLLLLQIASDQFPKLRTLQVASEELWPTTEREIAKSPAPAWAEALGAKGVFMLDGNGLHWTPRLKIPRRRGRS